MRGNEKEGEREKDSTTSASSRIDPLGGRALSIDRLRRFCSMAHDLGDEGRRILGETTDSQLRYPRLARDAKVARARLEARRAASRHDAFPSPSPLLFLSLFFPFYLSLFLRTLVAMSSSCFQIPSQFVPDDFQNLDGCLPGGDNSPLSLVPSSFLVPTISR